MEDLSGITYFLDSNKRVYFIYLISSFLLALIFIYFNPKSERVNFSSKLWLHPSSKLDYIFFFISNFIKIILILPIILSAKTVAYHTIIFLSDNFGLIRININYELLLLLFSITLFLVSDFTRYWVHRLMHTIPFLWEFHKVHHSAKVLNPITFYRVHPIENILFGFRYVFSIGIVTGVFIYLFGARIGLIEIFGVNIFIFVFSFFGSNLRHSHIQLSYPKFLEKIFISPKMHQIHHSTKYFDNNFGGYLAIWDYMFKSHLFSNEVKVLKFGIRKSQMSDYNTILKLFFIPFKCVVKLIK